MKNIKYLLVLLIALTAFISCVDDKVFVDDTGGVVEATIKLNEILSTGSPDWLELYNSGDEAVDLTGYALKDSNTKWTIPTMSIPAGGYIAFNCDGLDTNGSTSFKISSGGESISLFNKADELIDEVTTPDMSSQTGLTYGREVDGGSTWVVMSPSKERANSNVNTAPVINADPLTEFTDLYTIEVSDAGGVASVKLVHMIDGGVNSIDMALVDGKYKTTVPRANIGSTVKYYVVATDNTGLVSYYPTDGTTNPAEFTVKGGLEDLAITGENAGFRGIVTFKATPYYPEQVSKIKLYYLLPGELQDDTHDDKTSVTLTQNGSDWEGVVPAQDTDDVISYYLRVKYSDGTKTYYPLETTGGTFDHDQGTTWPSYTVQAITYDTVVNETINYTDGPLTSLTFPTNPIPGTDMNITLTYSSSVTITEARVYYDVGNSPIWVKKNKVKGENDASFTQTSVTVNMKDEVADNGLAVDQTGAKVTFVIRMQDSDGKEYYYDHNGTMYLDDTAAGGSTDQSDTIKGNTSVWSVFNVQ